MYPWIVATTTQTVAEVCAAAKAAAGELARLDTATKNAALYAMADALEQRSGEILEANERDMEAGREARLHSGLLDRLKLSEERLAGIARDVRAIASLPDPVGETIDGHRLENGLDVRRVRTPLGVVAVVYEARPNVTIDCSALCLKSGNAIVLRGSSIAAHSNAALAQVAASAIKAAGVPEAAISIVTGGDRDELRELATQEGVVDLVIPRGGEGLKAALKEHATVPVIYAAAGNCHVYVDKGADLDDAVAITVNAKVQRPSRLQRGGDPARARRRRRRSSSRGCCTSCASPASSCAWTAAPARSPASWPTRSARPPRRTGRPSTTR